MANFPAARITADLLQEDHTLLIDGKGVLRLKTSERVCQENSGAVLWGGQDTDQRKALSDYAQKLSGYQAAAATRLCIKNEYAHPVTIIVYNKLEQPKEHVLKGRVTTEATAEQTVQKAKLIKLKVLVPSN